MELYDKIKDFSKDEINAIVSSYEKPEVKLSKKAEV
jgi:hypothetical protein